MKRTTELIDHCSKFIEFQNMDSYRGIGASANNIGNMHYLNGNLKEAIMNYALAYEMIKKEEKVFKDKILNLEQNYDKKELANVVRIKATRGYNFARAVIQGSVGQSTRTMPMVRIEKVLKKVIIYFEQVKEDISILINSKIMHSIVAHELQKNDTSKTILKEIECFLESYQASGKNEKLIIEPKILNDRLLIHKARLAMKDVNFGKAEQLLKEYFFNMTIYDTVDQRDAQLLLKQTVEYFQQPEKIMEQYIKRLRPSFYDIFFMIDVSANMGGKKQKKIMELINKIYRTKLKPADRLGFLVFNDIPHMVMKLRKKEYNPKDIETVLHMSFNVFFSFGFDVLVHGGLRYSFCDQPSNSRVPNKLHFVS